MNPITRAALAGAALVALATAAPAADLVPPGFGTSLTPPPVFTWSGFYAGINAGYDFSHDSQFRSTATTTSTPYTISNGTETDGTPVTGSTKLPGFSPRVGDDGATAGAQAGYNYQFGAVVAGLEADIAYVDVGRRIKASDTVDGANAFNTNQLAAAHASLDYLGTVRGRLGYAAGSTLFYGTGGLAYGQTNEGLDFVTPGKVAYSHSSSETRTGYAYGGGIEYALGGSSFLNFFGSGGVTIKAEYLHYDLGSYALFTSVPVASQTNAAKLSQVLRIRDEVRGDLGRLGLNYKF